MRTRKAEEKPRVWYPDSQVKRVFTEDRASSLPHVKIKMRTENRGLDLATQRSPWRSWQSISRTVTQVKRTATPESRALCLHIFKATGPERRWQTQASLTAHSSSGSQGNYCYLRRRTWGKRQKASMGNVCHPLCLFRWLLNTICLSWAVMCSFLVCLLYLRTDTENVEGSSRQCCHLSTEAWVFLTTSMAENE